MPNFGSMLSSQEIADVIEPLVEPIVEPLVAPIVETLVPPIVDSSLNTHAALTTTAHGGIVAGNDPRLTDARTPTAHTHPDAFPIGSVFIAVVSTNPATLLGYGTWAALGAGRVLVGVDPSDPDFDAAEKTSGAKTVALTEAQIPAHTHVQDSHNHTQNAHNHVITSQTATTGSATSYEHGTLDTSSAETEATEVTANTVAVNQAATAVNQNTGGGQSHNNVQPSLACYFWKRTA